MLELRTVQFRKEMLGKRLVGIEVRRIDAEPCSERLDAGAAGCELVESVEARVGFGFRAAYHQGQTRQDGDMPGITPVLPRAVLDIGVVIERVFESRLYREDDVGSAGRKVSPLRRTASLHQDRLSLRRPPHLQRPGTGVVATGIVYGVDAVDIGPHPGVDVADQGAIG